MGDGCITNMHVLHYQSGETRGSPAVALIRYTRSFSWRLESDNSYSSDARSTIMALLMGLRDPRTFPSFDSCPSEDSIDIDYYSTKNGYLFRPTRHWCLLVEITHVEYFIRLRLHVRDKSGKEFPVACHPCWK